MFERRFRVVDVVVVIGALLPVAVPAEASPARRLARRGVIVGPPVIVAPPVVVAPPVFVPPPALGFVPPPLFARPFPPVGLVVPPGGPAVVVGPAGRVRGWIMPPGPVFGFGEVVTVTESPTAPAVAAPTVVTPPPDAAPRQVVTADPRPQPSPPRTLNAEPIPAPLPAPAADEGVVPAAAELEIPDGTQSILVQPSGGAATPADRR